MTPRRYKIEQFAYGGTEWLDPQGQFVRWEDYQEVERERDKLLAAIKEHHDQKADDRCILDDTDLYAAAGLGPADHGVGDKAAMLENCKRFIERRCKGGGWPTYAELEKQLEALKRRISNLEASSDNIPIK